MNTSLRSWKVLHACEYVRDVGETVEAQLAAGMRPLVVTPYAVMSGERALAPEPGVPRPVSLLSAWNNVRMWRQSMLDADPFATCDLVHAHSFASGMAAVRNYPVVVYDLAHFVEETDDAAAHDRAWLKRSFRVAEQFVLSRAAAVVVHSETMRAAARERGAPPLNLFVVPRPIADWPETPAEPAWLRALGVGERTLLYAHGLNPGSTRELDTLLAVADRLARDEPDVALVLSGDDVQELRNRLGPHVLVIASEDSPRALACADVVVAFPGSGGAALQALLHGRTLLAADCPEHREVSSAGRGLLWFRANDVSDLASRAIFLARTPEFRVALAAAGRQHLLETRSPAAVGARYHAVYTHAVARRKQVTPQSPSFGLEPSQAVL